ncbi:GNAT family N-acetyltransferase [Echinicola marina]|uniref:GNAT family N-acetyltransferase n=1 Tax=Echinicola marina TaxID=2859768 RepID=UPI001CF6C2A9|nr:GNAT family N-acetyltransferase [Echinicola marina]UCS93762.1 GNAT family N-acetyltransferase [Echinicola marina]
MNIKVKKVQNKVDLEQVFKIREEVFVEEQKVDREEEYDEFEETSTHFLASLEGHAVGTARWRFTEKGVKLERFAVLKAARGKGIGQALVAAVLRDIQGNSQAKDKLLYLHGQLGAVPLYEKFGFRKVGDIFTECDIQHYKMEKTFS